MKLSRREIIKGLGAVGLLSMLRVDLLLAKECFNAPVRVLFVPLQHGWGIARTSNRHIQGTQDEFTFPDGLEPFNAIRALLNVVPLLTLGRWGNNHDLSYADILTAGVPNGMTSSAFDSHMPLSVNSSIDYLLEQHSGLPTFRFSVNYDSWGVSYHPLSFDNASTVLPYYTNAHDAYQSIFKNQEEDHQSQAAKREKKLMETVFEHNKNSKDVNLDDLSPEDRDKMTRYISALDDVKERRTPKGICGTETLQEIPHRGQGRFKDLDHFLDMVKVGFANQMTTSAVLGIGDIHPIPRLHIDEAHYNSAVWWDTRRDFANIIVKFVNDLSSIIDSDGKTVMDNTVIVLTGEVGVGSHDVITKGHIVIGTAGGAFTTGRWLEPEYIRGKSNVEALMREDKDGVLKRQLNFGDLHKAEVAPRTNADLLREIGNAAGLSLSQFGLPSQNKGAVLI